LKKGPKYGLQKAGCKKQGQCYSKREEARLDLIFFQGHKPTNFFKTKIVGADQLGEWGIIEMSCLKNSVLGKSQCPIMDWYEKA